MNKSLQKHFLKIIKSNPDEYFNDYLQAEKLISNSTAIYKGEPVDFLYQALFFDLKEYRKLNEGLQTLENILDRVIKRYLKKPAFRRYFKFSALLEELILKDPGYDQFYPVGRFDLFYNNGEYKFCELNTDGSSAMNEVRVLENMIENTKIIKKIKNSILSKNELKLSGFELFHSLIDNILKNYRQYAEKPLKYPQVAIVDFEGDGTVYEFKEFQKRFMEKGCRTIICDPRQLKYRDGSLFFKDFRIDLIYRRATTARILEEAEESRDFLEAYLNGDVCLVGSFRSQIVHNKLIFAVLHNKKAVDFLNEDEKEFIDKHIPFTEITDLTNERIAKKLKSEKDRFILKPLDKYAGKGVYVGQDYSQQEWENILLKIKDKDYLYQDFVAVPQLEMPAVDGHKFSFEEFGFMIGLFVYNKKLEGLYTRAGRANIIGSIVESFTIPNLIVYREGCEWPEK